MAFETMCISIFMILLFFVLILFIGLFIVKELKNRNRLNLFKYFSDYIAVLEYHMLKAFDIIHKDQILIYSLSATTISDEDFIAVSHDFVNLVIKMIGPNLYNEFTELYGNDDTFIFNLVEYFNTRYEEDEIRKKSLEELVESNETSGEYAHALPIGSADGASP